MNIKSLNKNALTLIAFTILILSNLSAYAEKNYHMEIDDNSFDIKYDLDGEVIAMEIDKELNSLLIGTENVKDSQFHITLPNDLISAENNEFAILVNGFEVEYEVIETGDTNLTFFIPAYTEEIEIIGTYVIPEFPLGVVLTLGTITGAIILLQKSKKFFFR